MSASAEGREGGGVGESGPDLIVMAPNGVAWKRQPGGTTGREEFLAALQSLVSFDDVERH
jgi:hypothetical protein